MKRRITIVALSVAAVVVFSLLVAAEAPKASGKDSTEGVRGLSMERPEAFLGMIENPKVVELLSLSEDQKTQLKEKMQESRKIIVRLKADLENAAKEQARLLSNEATKMPELMQTVENAGKIRTEIAKHYIRSIVEVRKILTPEQQQKLQDMHHRFQEQRRKEYNARTQPGKGKPPAGDQKPGAER